MAPIFSNNTKYLKSSVQNGTEAFLSQEDNNIYSENLISIG